MLTPQQELAAHSVEKNVLVSAGAGSGKTHVLVERYVEILRRYPDISLDKIIAVTFTRKAAHEMRSRLKASFLRLSKEPEAIADGSYKRWVECLAEVDSARIGTIHSMCESILKAYPADSGIDPDFEVLDELISAEIAQEAIKQALRDAIAGPRESHAYRLLLNDNIDKIQETLRSLIKSSMQFDEALKTIIAQPAQSTPSTSSTSSSRSALTALTVEGLTAHAQSFIRQVQKQALIAVIADSTFRRSFEYICNNPHEDPKNALEGHRLTVIAFCETIFSGAGSVEKISDEELAARWQALAALATHKVGNVGGTKGGAQALRDSLKALKTTADAASAKIPQSLLPEDAVAFEMMIGLIDLYQAAKKLYEGEKTRRTALDYNDLIGRTCASLKREGSQARAYFNEKVRALLVDEFQDTNHLQAEMLTLLAGTETRVFFIGDDKQSIYKFQGADVSEFNHWKKMLSGQTADLTGESMVTKLTKSFRSHPDVVAFVNEVFALLLDGDPAELPYVAAFEALEPAREKAAPIEVDDSAAMPQAVEVHLYDEDDGALATLSPDQLEACQVAHWIKGKVDNGALIEEKGGATRPITYGDFAVLVSKNSDFDKFEEIFPRAGIPYVTFGGKGFLKRQEVTDFENLFRFLDNPKDSHSLLAVLRSPLCPLTDDLIHKVALGQIGNLAQTSDITDKPLWVRLTEAARATGDSLTYSGDRQSLMQAVAVLRTMLDYASLLPLGELVHKIITLTHFDLVLLACDDGKQRSRNVWKLAHMAREHENLSCGEFARLIHDLREFGAKEPEAPLDSCDAVKLMTVHASKGLEFPAVALPCLGGQLTKNPDRLIFHRTYGVAYNTKRPGQDIKPAWFETAAHFNKLMEIEERKRLLYVAMTRARDCLGLFIRHEGRKTPSYRLWLKEHLGIDTGHVSLPDADQYLTVRMGNTATFSLAYRFGFPPLDLSSPYKAILPSPVGSLNLLDDEEALSPVFESPVNELAFVRLTPRRQGPDSGSEFIISSPRVTGTFFHALLENLPRSKKVDRDWVRDIAVNQGFHFVHPLRLEAFVDEGMRLLEIYYTSPLRALVDGAHRRYSEVPYLMDSGDFVALKRPDLILEAADGQWYLIDYKTDKFDRQQVARQVRKHGEQLLGYARDLKRISGIDLRAALYFAQYGLVEDVSLVARSGER